ncbi:S8 family serine peptidase [Psychrobacillus sp. L4]|uniref:S8 family serine peptidase n=1 Tax=Psychrobacillus sp. L4 TaxID=3236892 RepID=UPI0036F27D67
MLKLRRILLMTLVFMLSFSNVAFGMGTVSNAKSKASLPTLQLQKPEHNIPERLVEPENPNEKVRIIVELTNAPTIEKATKKGVLYKELNSSDRKSLESTVTKEQVNVQSTITKKAPTIEYLENFTTVFNGFSAEVEAKYVDQIASIPGVKAVYESTEYERPTEKPEMIYSKELVQAQRAWNEYGVRGEGMVVGIIDTGIDPSHKDMVLTDNAKGLITKAKVDQLLTDGTIGKGKFFTPKVPFGYNYMDGNNQILDLGPDASMHGMHVAGTVGANGNEKNGGIKGVAPEAQLLALKVFGNDPGYPSTFGDIYVKAIDDAIKLGVDVLNMSLGSTAGFVDASNPEQQAVKRATDNGVLVAISAGNSDMFGSGTFYPYAENQDYGLTGSPSVSYNSFGVASFENSVITAYSFDYQFDKVKSGSALYLLANDADPMKTLAKPTAIVDAGIGNPQDFVGKDFKGKIALISRGTIDFVSKGKNAQAAGAVGVIVYNNTVGTINMVSDPAIKIPYMSALQADGVKLKTALESGKAVTVSFEGNFVETKNDKAGKMSDFTSWGPTPNLDFKPEITAPGGNIFSTLNDNKYGLMSGTSMAAPHVSGGTALILERVNKEFKLTGYDRVQLAKNLLMNTSKPVEFKKGEFVSPRRQGSGLMQLANALSTDVVVTNKATGEGKVALKEIKNDQITFTLEAKNYSSKEKTYNVNVAVQTDAFADAGVLVTAPNLLGSFVVTDDVSIDTLDKLVLPANGTKTFEVKIDIKDLEELKDYLTNGFFVDGFVTLTDSNEAITGNVPLTVPFFGYNGKWDEAPIFDYFAWDDMSYWGMTALADEQGNFIDGGGNFDTTRFGFSPNGDEIRDKAIPVFSLFRNAKELKVAVLDSKGKVVRTIRTAKDLTKNYILKSSYRYNTNYGWDGKINNKLAADGDYFIQLSAVIDFEGAKWQSIKFPVKVDTIAPTAKVTLDNKTNAVLVSDFKDNVDGTGADYWQVLVNGKEVSEELSAKDNEFLLDSSLTSKDLILVKVWDAAGNFSDYLVSIPTESDHPVIFIESPDFHDIYNTSEVKVYGTVDDASNIVSVKVNDEEAEFDGVNFSHTLTLSDGVKDIRVAAIDEFGNEMQITRKIFVDTQAPTITVSGVTDGQEVSLNEENPKATVTVGDNFDEVRIYLNGSEVFSHELSEPYKMDGYNKEIEVEIPLINGTNDYVFEVEDLAGHRVSSDTFTISKLDVTFKVNKVKLALTKGDTDKLVVTETVKQDDGSTTSEDVTSEATFISGNKEIVTVVGGVVTAIGVGKTSIEVLYNDQIIKTVPVDVTEEVTEVEDVITLHVDKTDLSLTTGTTDQLTVTEVTTPENGNSTVKNVTLDAKYVVANKSIVSVTNGKVTAKAKGETTITITYNENEVGVVKVKVTDPVVNPGGGGGSYYPSQPKVEDIKEEAGTTITNTSVKRTTELDGTVKDVVTLVAKDVKDSIKKLKEQNQDTARIIISDKEDKVNEVSVAIPKDAVDEFANGKANLEIFTANAHLYIPQTSMQDFGKDLNFRVVPMKEEAKKNAVEERAKKETVVNQIVGNKKVNVIGRPMVIETNMQNRSVDLTLPIPTNATKEQLDNLAIFIEHSDGTKEVVQGKLVEFSKNAQGLKFNVTKFSTFTILYMEGAAKYFAQNSCGESAKNCLQVNKTTPLYVLENNRLKKVGEAVKGQNLPVKQAISPMLGLGGDIWLERTAAISYETPSKDMIAKNQLPENKRPKQIWKGLELNPGQIGKVTILKDTVIWQSIDKTTKLPRVLKKGEQYRVYRYVPGMYQISDQQYIVQDSNVKLK